MIKKIWLLLVILGLAKGYGAYKESSFSFDCGKTPRAVHYTAQGFKADTTYFLKLYVSKEENGTPIYLKILSENGAWISADEDTWQDNLPSFTTMDNGYKEGWVYVRNNEIEVGTYNSCAFSVREGTSGETMKPGVFRPATVMDMKTGGGWLEGKVLKDGKPASDHLVFLALDGKVLGAVDSEPNNISDDNLNAEPGYFKIALPSGTIVSTITDWDGNLYEIPNGEGMNISSNSSPQGGPWVIMAGQVTTLGMGVLANEDIVINEIMYDPLGDNSDRQWIEIYNAGNSSITIATSTWKFRTDNTNHKLELVMGTNTLQPGSYAVIAQNNGSFTTDYSQFTGNLFDSSWTNLVLTSGTLSLTDGSSIFGTVTYGASGVGTASEGYSLERISPTANNWGQSLVGSRTPGALNSLSYATIVGTVTSTNNNIISGATVTVGASITTTSINGTYTIAGLVPGTYNVTAQKQGYEQATITINLPYGTTTIGTLSLQALPATITITVTPTTISAGGTATITGTVTDTEGSLTTTTVYWTATPTTGVTLPETSTTTNGTATITFTATITGTYIITGTGTGTNIGTATIIVQIGTPTQLEITLSTSTITADGTATITAIAKDNNGNTETVSTQLLSVDDPKATIEDNVFTPYTAGTWTITGTYTGTFGTLTNTATITVTPGIAAKISGVNRVGTDSTFNLEIKITDQKNNPVSQIPNISWTIVNGSGTLVSSVTTSCFNTLTVGLVGKVIVKATITTAAYEFTITRAQGFIAQGQLGEVTFETAYGTVTVLGTATTASYIYIATSTITANLKNKRQIGNIIEISTYGTDGTTLTGILGTFTLELPYSSSWNVSPNTLRIYKSTNTTYWVDIPSSLVGNVIRGTIYDFSWFTLGGISAGQPTLEHVFAYPNPWKKSGKTTITFKKLTPNATIRIFNVAGEEVIGSPIPHTDGTDEERWTVPDKLASGVYIYLIESPNVKNKIGKLGIIK